MPDNFAAPSHRALAEVVRSARWRSPLEALLRPAPVASAEDYFRWLAPHADAVDLWTTEYLHVLAPKPGGEHPVVAWMRGTALTPYLSELDSQPSANSLRTSKHVSRRRIRRSRTAGCCIRFGAGSSSRRAAIGKATGP